MRSLRGVMRIFKAISESRTILITDQILFSWFFCARRDEDDGSGLDDSASFNPVLIDLINFDPSVGRAQELVCDGLERISGLHDINLPIRGSSGDRAFDRFLRRFF